MTLLMVRWTVRLKSAVSWTLRRAHQTLVIKAQGLSVYNERKMQINKAMKLMLRQRYKREKTFVATETTRNATF